MTKHKYTWSAAAAALGFALAVPGQDTEALAKLRDTKLSEAWVTQAPWLTSFADAKAKAAAENKLIFAYFTRSYAP